MKKSRSWFSCSFFLPSFQTTCLAARTIVQAQQVRLAAGEEVKVFEQLFIRRSGSQVNPAPDPARSR